MNLRILTNFTDPFMVNVSADSGLKDLQQKIKHFLDLSVDDLEFIFRNQTINDFDKKLRDYGVCNGSIIKLILHLKRSSFKIEIDDQCRGCFEIEVQSTETLKEVKRKIEAHCQLEPEEQILYFHGNMLEGNGTISSYGVQEHSCVTLLKKFVKMLNLSIKMNRMKVFEVKVRVNATLDELRKSIRNIVELQHQDTLIIMFQGNVLYGNEGIGSLGVVDKSSLEVFVSKEIFFRVFLKEVEQFQGLIRNEKTIKDLKIVIEGRTGINRNNQNLKFKERRFENTAILHNIGLTNGGVVNVSRKMLNISIEMYGSNEFQVQILARDKLIEVKEKIRSRLKLNQGIQGIILNYQERVLSGNDEIRKYGVDEGSIIYVFMLETISLRIVLVEGEVIVLNIPNERSIQNLQEYLERRTGIKDNDQIITYKHRKLEQMSTLHNAGISNGATLVVRQMNITVHVRITANSQLHIEISENLSVKELRRIVERRTTLDMTDHELIFKGRSLRDGDSCKTHQIVHDSRINLVSISHSHLVLFIVLMVIIWVLKELCL